MLTVLWNFVQSSTLFVPFEVFWTFICTILYNFASFHILCQVIIGYGNNWEMFTHPQWPNNGRNSYDSAILLFSFLTVTLNAFENRIEKKTSNKWKLTWKLWLNDNITKTLITVLTQLPRVILSINFKALFILLIAGLGLKCLTQLSWTFHGGTKLDSGSKSQKV